MVLADANAVTDSKVWTRAAANTRQVTEGYTTSREAAGQKTNGEVEFAISAAILVSNEIAHTNVDENVSITSKTGNVLVKATGKGGSEALADAVIFKDGYGGIAVAVAVDNADVKAQVDGKLTAENPSADVLTFTATAVDTGNATTNSTITVDVPLHRKLSRGSQLVYHAGSLGDLNDGDTYTVLEVQDLAGAPTGFVRQKITLSNGLSIGLDARQTDAASMQTLEELGLVTFASAQVSEDSATHHLVIDMTGLSDGDLVTYRGPSSSSTFDVKDGTFTTNSLDKYSSSPLPIRYL